MLDRAVKGIILNKNKVLILKQVIDNKIFYSLPGGRVDIENFENELLREIKEETNLDVNIIKYINDWSFIRKNDNKTICKIYLCTPLNNTLTADNSEDYENIEEFLWLTHNEIKNCPMNKKLKKIILKVIN